MSHPDEWNDGLEPIKPLMDYYAREMGQLAGRLMAALSLLVDLEDSYGWAEQGRQARHGPLFALAGGFSLADRSDRTVGRWWRSRYGSGY